jgi:hypothetical protein
MPAPGGSRGAAGGEADEAADRAGVRVGASLQTAHSRPTRSTPQTAATRITSPSSTTSPTTSADSPENTVATRESASRIRGQRHPSPTVTTDYGTEPMIRHFPATW